MKKKKIKKRVKLRDARHNKLKIIAVITAIILIIWLITKLLIVNAFYDIQVYDDFFNAYNNKIYYEIKDKYDGTDLFEYKNIKFKNYLDNTFKKTKVNTLKKDGSAVQYYSETEKSALNVGIDYSYTDMFSEEITYFSDDHLFVFFSNNKNIRKRILEKNNISNDLDLFRYMNDVNNTKVSIFTPIYKIEELASVKLFASVILPSIEEFVVLNGDYQGYVFVSEHVKEISIFKDNKKYFIGLLGNKFKYKDFEEILNSLVIE